MGRTRNKTSNDHTRIERPRFPRLNTLHAYQVLQYQYGRKFIIDKVEYLAWKFEHQLDACVKPYIRETTEPYEILIWYKDAIKEYLASQGPLEENIDKWIKLPPNELFEDTDTDECHINQLEDQPEIFMVGMDWTEKMPEDYKTWFKYIFTYLSSIGFYSSWDYCREYMVDPAFMKEWYEIENHEEIDLKKENHKDYMETIAEIEKLSDQDCPFKVEEPKELPKPKNQLERYLSNELERALTYIHLIGDYQLWANYLPGDGDDGALPLHEMFWLVDNADDMSPFVAQHIVELHIEQTANNCGVAPWRFGMPHDAQFDIDAVNSDKYEYINQLGYILIHTEQHIYDNYGKLFETK